MRAFLLLGGLVLLGNKRTEAQITTMSQKAFLVQFQRAMGELSQPKANEASAIQYFLSDTSKVADTSYPQDSYELLHPVVGAKIWLNELNSFFGNVLFYTIDTTRVKVSNTPGKRGQQLSTLRLLVTLEGLRDKTQSRHQLTEEQIWQLTEIPKNEDKWKLGYRIVSIRSSQQPLQSVTLTASRIEILQKQLRENLIRLAWEGTDNQQRKLLVDQWHQQHYPDTLYITQNKEQKKILLADWGKQRINGPALADVAVASLDMRWADSVDKSVQKDPIRRITEWKNMRLSLNDSLFFKSRNIFYEKIAPSAKLPIEPTLTIVHIYVER